MSDFFDAFRDPTFPGPRAAGGVGDLGATFRPEEEYERGFFERAFAPFQAPQEGLFKFTQNVADDGFQITDITNAMGHAASYFNPWSNVKPIDPNEIREIFMGKDAEVNGFLKFGGNLAISLLYDPLLFTGLAKGLGMVGKGTRAARNLDRIANPASALIEGTRIAAKNTLSPAIHSIGRRVLGEAEYNKITTSASQWLVDRFAGVPEELKRRVLSFDARVTEWRMQAFNVIKKADRLGGEDAQRLLGEALETRAVFLSRTGQAVTDAKDIKKLAQIEQRLAQSGINEDLFYQVYDQARKLDDKIGMELWRSGMISRDAVEGMSGMHLRKVYEAFERPDVYLDRLEKLRVARPDLARDVERVSIGTLRRNLSQLPDQSVGAGGFRAVRPTDRAGREMFRDRVNASPYFDPQQRNALDIDRFSGDLINWLDGNSDATVAEVFEHVENVMLGGTKMDDRFWQTIGHHLSGAKYTQHGIDRYVSKLRQMTEGGGTQFRRFAERAEIIAKRENVPDEIRQALGHIDEMAPRIAAEAADAGKLAEVHALFDDIAGVKRVSTEAGTFLQRAKQHITRGEDIPAPLMDDLRRTLGRDVSAEEIMKLDTGSVLERGTGAWSSVEETAEFSVRLPEHSSYGAAAGMHVAPGVAMMLRQLGSVGDLASDPVGMAASRFGRVARNLTSRWKMMKVVMDPTAQFRNFIGNMVLMDMQGTNPFRIDRMIKSTREVNQFLSTGTKGRYMQLLEDAGAHLLENTFGRQELMDIALRIGKAPVTRDNWIDTLKGAYKAIGEQFGPDGAPAKIFQLNEGMFKLSVFVDKYEGMMRPLLKKGKQIDPDLHTSIVRQAAGLAEQALFNYADVPHLVDMVRRYGIVPFATFPFKAIPYAADTLYKHPHRVLKYERASEVWNEHWAGSPDDVAREIQALPQHARESMVVRLPFKDNQGRPLYLDASFFLPWEPLREMVEDLSGGVSGLLGAPEGGVGDYGARGGILSPPITVILDAIRHNQDSLGRPIFKDSMSTEEKFMAAARFMYEFVAPPSAPGGSRANSLGRAMQSMAHNSPEVADWVEMMGRGLRVGGGQDNIRPAPGMNPQTQAQVNSPLGPALGTLLGFTGGAMASDTRQARMQEVAKFQGTNTDLARQIASIRTDPDLSIAEKRRRIARLHALLIDQSKETRSYLQSL
jgi:hypothetical protein